VKFDGRPDQDPETYDICRRNAGSEDLRAAEDIPQQEIKNAICLTLQAGGILTKEALVKETIRTMGFGRSGAALAGAVERGLKYGRRKGEIIQSGVNQFHLPEE